MCQSEIGRIVSSELVIIVKMPSIVGTHRYKKSDGGVGEQKAKSLPSLLFCLRFICSVFLAYNFVGSLKYSLVVLTATPLWKRRPIRFGHVISPLKISDIVQTVSNSTVAPRELGDRRRSDKA